MRGKKERVLCARPAQRLVACPAATSGLYRNYAPSEGRTHERAGPEASSWVGRSEEWMINT